MTATNDTDALLIAYVDGELDASAARALEARIAADPALRAEVEGLRATKALLGSDAQWGKVSQVDEAPAHLLNAIMNAEALARPKQIRDAAALVAAPPASFTAKMARWLLGGGALVAGAATVLVLVTSEEASLSSAAPATTLAEEVNAGPATDGLTDRTAVAVPVRQNAPDAPPPAESPSVSSPSVSSLSVDAEDAKPTDAFREKGASSTRDGPTKLADPTAGYAPSAAPTAGLGRVAAGPGARGGDNAEKAEKADKAAERRADQPVSRAPQAVVREEPKAEMAFDDGTADGDLAAAAAPPPPPAQTGTGASLDAKERSLSIADARKELYQRRVDAKTRGVPPSPANDSATAKKPAKPQPQGKAPQAKAKDAAESKKSAKAVSDEDEQGAATGGEEMQSPAEMKRRQMAESAFTTGMRELQGKRYIDALTAFDDAEKLDPKHLMGVSPVVGQMRCYKELKRPADVARLARRLRYANIKAPDVVDGMLLGADAAENTGDLELAEALWTRLLEDPKQKANAQRALERTRRPMRNKAALEADAAAAEAPPPAASPPAATESK